MPDNTPVTRTNNTGATRATPDANLVADWYSKGLSGAGLIALLKTTAGATLRADPDTGEWYTRAETMIVRLTQMFGVSGDRINFPTPFQYSHLDGRHVDFIDIPITPDLEKILERMGSGRESSIEVKVNSTDPEKHKDRRRTEREFIDGGTTVPPIPTGYCRIRGVFSCNEGDLRKFGAAYNDAARRNAVPDQNTDPVDAKYAAAVEYANSRDYGDFVLEKIRNFKEAIGNAKSSLPSSVVDEIDLYPLEPHNEVVYREAMAALLVKAGKDHPELVDAIVKKLTAYSDDNPSRHGKSKLGIAGLIVVTSLIDDADKKLQLLESVYMMAHDEFDVEPRYATRGMGKDKTEWYNTILQWCGDLKGAAGQLKDLCNDNSKFTGYRRLAYEDIAYPRIFGLKSANEELKLSILAYVAKEVESIKKFEHTLKSWNDKTIIPILSDAVKKDSPSRVRKAALKIARDIYTAGPSMRSAVDSTGNYVMNPDIQDYYRPYPPPLRLKAAGILLMADGLEAVDLVLQHATDWKTIEATAIYVFSHFEKLDTDVATSLKDRVLIEAQKERFNSDERLLGLNRAFPHVVKIDDILASLSSEALFGLIGTADQTALPLVLDEIKIRFAQCFEDYRLNRSFDNSDEIGSHRRLNVSEYKAFSLLLDGITGAKELSDKDKIELVLNVFHAATFSMRGIAILDFKANRDGYVPPWIPERFPGQLVQAFRDINQPLPMQLRLLTRTGPFTRYDTRVILPEGIRREVGDLTYSATPNSAAPKNELRAAITKNTFGHEVIWYKNRIKGASQNGLAIGDPAEVMKWSAENNPEIHKAVAIAEEVLRSQGVKFELRQSRNYLTLPGQYQVVPTDTGTLNAIASEMARLLNTDLIFYPHLESPFPAFSANTPESPGKIGTVYLPYKDLTGPLSELASDIAHGCSHAAMTIDGRMKTLSEYDGSFQTSAPDQYTYAGGFNEPLCCALRCYVSGDEKVFRDNLSRLKKWVDIINSELRTQTTRLAQYDNDRSRSHSIKVYKDDDKGQVVFESTIGGTGNMVQIPWTPDGNFESWEIIKGQDLRDIAGKKNDDTNLFEIFKNKFTIALEQKRALGEKASRIVEVVQENLEAGNFASAREVLEGFPGLNTVLAHYWPVFDRLRKLSELKESPSQ